MLSEKSPFSSGQKSSFFRNVLSLSAGTVVAQAMSFASAPLITRLYSPADLGTLAVFISISGILSVICCFCYELSIVLPEDESVAANLFVISAINCIAFSTVVAAALFFSGKWLLYLGPGLSEWLWLLPVYILSSGMIQALNYWCTRKKYFNWLAASRMAQSLVLVTAQIGLGVFFLGKGPGGLIAGYVLGVVFALAVLGTFVWASDRSLLNRITFREALRAVSSYRRFSAYSSSIALVNISSHQVPVLMLGYFFEAGVLGLYSLGYRVLSTPMMLCGNSIAQVFYPDAVEKSRSGGLSIVARSIFHKLFKLAFIPTILLTIFAPDVFGFVFGAGWREAGVYAQFLLPAFFLQFISSPLSHIFYVLDIQSQLLSWNIALLATRLISITAGAFSGEPILAVMLIGVSGFFMYSMLLFKVLRLCGIHDRAVYSGLLVNVLSGVLLGAALAFLNARFDSVQFGVAAFSLFFLLFLAVSLWKFMKSARGER